MINNDRGIYEYIPGKQLTFIDIEYHHGGKTVIIDASDPKKENNVQDHSIHTHIELTMENVEKLRDCLSEILDANSLKV